MNAKGKVKEAMSTLAWHESYEHSHQHPDILERMREHTDKAVEELEAAQGKPFMQGLEHKREAKREAAAARAEHDVAMRAYQGDVAGELRGYEERNERKVAARVARDPQFGVDPNADPETRTGLGAKGVSRRGTLSFAGAENGRRLKATEEREARRA